MYIDLYECVSNNDRLILLYIFFTLFGHHRDLHVLTHSFPTRRSSDLGHASHRDLRETEECRTRRDADVADQRQFETAAQRIAVYGILRRSEEHTSELQSLLRISYAVFCLKKKTQSLTYTP